MGVSALLSVGFAYSFSNFFLYALKKAHRLSDRKKLLTLSQHAWPFNIIAQNAANGIDVE